jgi:CBS domain-containing protein
MPMLTVADIMTRIVQTIDRTATVETAIAQMQVHSLRSLIVNRPTKDMPFGIVTERDIVYKVFARGLEPTRVQVQDIMRQPCIAVSPHLPLQTVAQLLSDTGIQRAPVIQDGELLGVLSVTDLVMKGFIHRDPYLVGALRTFAD